MKIIDFNLITRSCIIIALLFSLISTNAQVTDTFDFGELRVDESLNNTTYQVETIHDSYLFMNRQWDINLQAYRFSIIITDLDFYEKNRIDTISIFREFGSVSINVINDIENSIVLNKVEYIDDIYVYSTHLLDLSSMEMNPVDSIIMPVGKEISYTLPIHAVHNNSYERFGIIKDSNGGTIYSNCFIKIQTNGIINIDYINLTESIKRPALHLYIDELNSYFIPDDINDFFVLDDEFQFQYKIPGKTFYKKGDTTYHATLYTCFCRFQEDKVHVLGRTSFSISNYAFLHATLPVVNEKILMSDKNWPLFDVKNFKGRTQSTLCREDSEGNIIAVTDDNFNMGQTYSEENLYIQKVNKDYKNEWFIGFNNDSEFYLRGLVVDKNDDIVIVGNYARGDFAPEVHNFYLKVNTAGLVSATQGTLPSGMFVLYPNPTSENVSLNGPTENISTYTIYDIQGKKVKSLSYGEDNKINLEGLGAGTYFIHFSNKKGEIINSSKVIKY